MSGWHHAFMDACIMPSWMHASCLHGCMHHAFMDACIMLAPRKAGGTHATNTKTSIRHIAFLPYTAGGHGAMSTTHKCTSMAKTACDLKSSLDECNMHATCMHHACTMHAPTWCAPMARRIGPPHPNSFCVTCACPCF